MSEYAFVGSLSCKRFKEMLCSVQPISDTVNIRFHGVQDTTPLTYWADDGDGQRPTSAIIGVTTMSMFRAVAGGRGGHVIQVNVKALIRRVAAFDTKRDINLILTSKDNKPLLIMEQWRTAEDQEAQASPDSGTVSVSYSEVQPVTPVLPKGAYATVNLDRLNKVLQALKQTTDTITVNIRPGEFEVNAITKRLQDGWTQPTTTKGSATGVFAAGLLKNAVAAAVQADNFGEVHLAEDSPIKIQSVSEDLTVAIYLADREGMEA